VPTATSLTQFPVKSGAYNYKCDTIFCTVRCL